MSARAQVGARIEYARVVSDSAPSGIAERVALAFTAMSDGVVVADRRTGQVLVNPAARRLLGLDPDAAITTTFLSERLGFYPFDLVAAGGGEVREEVRVGGRQLSSAVSAMIDDAGAPIGAVVVLREPPPERDEARRRAEVAQMISHELRTPLTSIAGALDIVLSGYAGPLNEKLERYVAMARHAATRMNELLDELLDASRARAGTISLTTIAIDLIRLTRDTVTRYRDVAAGRKVGIEIHAEAETMAFHGDPERLAQVLGNLLSNSIKFAPIGGTIDVEVFGPPVVADAVGVSVYNAGEPIPEDERERIFEPFATAGRRVGGTGLGLGASRAIIEAHGGHIWVESNPTGTKFVFTLPAAPVPRATERRTIPMRAQTGDPARVLIVDNDRHRAYLLKGLLMADGHAVSVADDADAALAQARTDRPSLAVVAGTLPNATALLAILEHDPDTRKTAVLALAEPGRTRELIAAGAEEVVELPLQPYALGDTCQRLLTEAGRREAPRVLVVDDDDSIRAICREVLEHAGYTVREVGSSDGAVLEARRFRPDLVLLDVMMPIVDGFRTAERSAPTPPAAWRRSSSCPPRPTPPTRSARSARAPRTTWSSRSTPPSWSRGSARRSSARPASWARRRPRSCPAPTRSRPRSIAASAPATRDALCCYLDLDNLKAYNDYYGYAKADGVIRQTGDLIRDMVSRHGTAGDFVGHIAGDDFVFVTDTAHGDQVCRAICAQFDRLIPLYYNRDDRARGFIETKDRWGVIRKFQTMSVSIAAVELRAVSSFSELATAAAAGKQQAKAVVGSAYVRGGQVLLGTVTPSMMTTTPIATT